MVNLDLVLGPHSLMVFFATVHLRWIEVMHSSPVQIE